MICGHFQYCGPAGNGFAAQQMATASTGMPNYRLDDNPPSIFPGGEIADLVMSAPTWWLVRTPNRHEKSVAWHFAENNIAYYLPLVKRKDEWRRSNLFPLFPTYLFAAPQPGRDIRSKLFVADIVHEDWRLVVELAQLKAAIDAGTIKTLADLKPGDHCEVTDGEWKGMEGEIDHIDHRGRFAFLTGLMKNSEARIPIQYLEAIPPGISDRAAAARRGGSSSFLPCAD